MDTLDCPNLELADHRLRSAHAYRIRMELGDHRCSRPICSGGLSRHRSPTADVAVPGRRGIGYRLALGAIGRNDLRCFRIGNDCLTSGSRCENSRFPSFSNSLSDDADSGRACNTIPGKLVAIQTKVSPRRQRLTRAWRVAAISDFRRKSWPGKTEQLKELEWKARKDVEPVARTDQGNGRGL
jgi:hypothetical protein